MGMFDWVTFDGAPDPADDPAAFQSKDGPCALRVIDRDAVDQFGAYLVNEYYGSGKAWRRGPGGWVEVSRRERRVIGDE